MLNLCHCSTFRAQVSCFRNASKETCLPIWYVSLARTQHQGPIPSSRPHPFTFVFNRQVIAVYACWLSDWRGHHHFDAEKDQGH